jgi:hypothetical protein
MAGLDPATHVLFSTVVVAWKGGSSFVMAAEAATHDRGGGESFRRDSTCVMAAQVASGGGRHARRNHP